LELLPEKTKASYLDTKARVAEVTVRIQDLGIAHYEPVFRRVEQRLSELQAKYPGFVLTLTGDPVTRGRNLYRIVTDLASSLGTAAITIFIVMTLAYRSLRIGLITLIPNLFPLAVTACMMVLFGHPLEIASVCAFTVCLGIAVDDTIHFLTQYRSELDRHGNVETALRDAFQGVGSAMIITTFILITGFGTVLTSDLPGQRYFAAMAVSTIAAALVGDLVFLPALLATFSRERHTKTEST
jgi:predicted RND superfamily exporter protein